MTTITTNPDLATAPLVGFVRRVHWSFYPDRVAEQSIKDSFDVARRNLSEIASLNEAARQAIGQDAEIAVGRGMLNADALAGSDLTS